MDVFWVTFTMLLLICKVYPMPLDFCCYQQRFEQSTTNCMLVTIYKDAIVGSCMDPTTGFRVCYYTSTGMLTTYARIEPVDYPYWYLTANGFQTIINYMDTEIVSIASAGDRLHNYYGPTVTPSINQAYFSRESFSASQRYLYGTLSNTGYQQAAYSWHIFPYCKFNYSKTIQITHQWGGGSCAVKSLNAADEQQPGKCQANTATYYLAFRNRRVVTKRLRVLQRRTGFYFSFHVLNFTVYTGSQNSTMDRNWTMGQDSAMGQNYATREAVVIYEPNTNRYLTPKTHKHFGHIKQAGNWINSNNTAVPYSYVIALNWDTGYYGRVKAGNNGSNPVLPSNIRNNTFPDDRFFYREPTLNAAVYRLRMVNHMDYYLAVLKVNGKRRVVVTKIHDDIPGRVTYLFTFTQG